MALQLLLFAGFLSKCGVFGQGKNSRSLQLTAGTPPFFAHAHCDIRSCEEEHNVFLRAVVAEMRLATGRASQCDQRERGVRERRSKAGTHDRCQSWNRARFVELYYYFGIFIISATAADCDGYLATTMHCILLQDSIAYFLSCVCPRETAVCYSES